MTDPGERADLFELDETVGGAPLDRLPDGAAREALLQQRVAHGLLRALYTSDAESRECRVQRIVAALPSRQGAAILTMRRAVAVAASVLVLGVLTVSFWPESRLDAAIRGAARFMDDEHLDRRFELQVSSAERSKPLELRGKHHLTVSAAGDFLLDIDGKLGKFLLGSHRGEAWFRRIADHPGHPPTEQEINALLEEMQDGVFDLGFLDIERVLELLPGSDKLRLVGTAPAAEPGGSEVLLIEAVAAPVGLLFGGPLRTVLRIDEGRGALLHLELDVRSPLGLNRVHLTFDYMGSVDHDEARYREPASK